MNKKVLRIIISVLFVIIIVLVLMYYFISTKQEESLYTKEDLEMIDSSIENYLSDKITPKGIAKLYGGYEGENDLNDMYRGIYKFVNYLPELSKEIKYDKIENVKEYYNNNTNKIKENLTINNIDDFIAFIDFLNENQYNGEDFIDCQIDSETFKNNNSYFSCEIKFNFEELNNDFRLLLHFANNNHTQPKLYFSMINETEEIQQVEFAKPIEDVSENVVNKVVE